MKTILKTIAFLMAVFMLFCVIGCGDTAGGGIPSTPSESQFVALETPLTLEAIEAGTITLSHSEKMTNLKFRKNGGNFVSVTASMNLISVAASDKIEFYADGSANNYDSSTGYTAFKIECSADCYIYGNIMSLLDSSDFKNATSISTENAFSCLFIYNTHIKNHAQKALVLPATNLAQRCYGSMFMGCTGLTNAPALPAMSLAQRCYESMFYGCTGLTSSPSLPATTLEQYCYSHMFYGCTGLTRAHDLSAMVLAQNCCSFMFSGCTELTNAPALPATTLAQSCYSNMFSRCTALTSAPVLYAATLEDSCYYYMFNNCTNLTSVTCLATDISASDCTFFWFGGVATTGTRTFTKAASMDDWDGSISGIPSGWTVVDYTAPQQ